MESIRRKQSMLMCVSVLVMVCGSTSTMAAKPSVPAMFVFGDSMADDGNNHILPDVKVRADMEPYGVTFFHSPTGRFTNGRNAFDFIATKLGLPFLPPSFAQNANLSKGMNFASGGSGFLDDTRAEFHVLNMSFQITQFENLSESLITELGPEQAASFLANSLYTVASGANDLLQYFENLFHIPIIGPGENGTIDTDAPGLISVVLAKVEEDLTRLYRIGARKLLVWDIIPLGCTPLLRNARFNVRGRGDECFALPNMVAEQYNSGLKLLVDKLNGKLGGASVVLVNTFDYLTNLIEHGEAFGLTVTKSSCCGSGNFNTAVTCGKTPQPVYCGDKLKKHLFWDGVHPTERVFKMMSRDVWSGNSSFVYPINLSQLVGLEENTSVGSSSPHSSI